MSSTHRRSPGQPGRRAHAEYLEERTEPGREEPGREDVEIATHTPGVDVLHEEPAGEIPLHPEADSATHEPPESARADERGSDVERS